MVWQRRYSAAPRMCMGAATAQCSVLWYNMPSLPQLAYTSSRKVKFTPNTYPHTMQAKSIVEIANAVANYTRTTAHFMWCCLQYAWICRSPACALHLRSYICLRMCCLDVLLVHYTRLRYLASVVDWSGVPSSEMSPLVFIWRTKVLLLLILRDSKEQKSWRELT